MKSLRTQLLVRVCGAAAGVMVALAAGLFVWVRSQQIEQLDRRVHELATLIVSTIEVEGNSVELDFEELDLSDFQAGVGSWYLCVWIDNQPAYRSPSFGSHDPLLTSYQPSLGDVSWVTLPKSSPGRGLLLSFESDHSPPIPVTVFIACDATATLSAVGQLAVWLVAMTAAAVVAVALILAATVHRGLRPVAELATRIGQVGATDLSQRVNVSSMPTELEPIVDQFNALLGRLRSAFERERGFCADVAHELRTPLAGLRTTLEVAGARPRSADQYAQTVQRCRVMVEQTQSLIEYLLMISNFETGQVAVNPEWIDLDQQMPKLWQELTDHATSPKNHQVNWHLGIASPVWTDWVVWQVVLRNVFKNAIEHVDDHGHVEITSTLTSAAVTITIANTGSRIAADDADKVFDRFWRGNTARSDTGVHFGLGLSLAQRAMVTLGGKLSVETQMNGQFRVICQLAINPPSTPTNAYGP